MKITKCLLLLLIGILAAGCSTSNNSENDMNSSPKENRAIPVSLIDLKPVRVEWMLDVVGLIHPNKDVHISSEVAGKVIKVDFNNGDYVNKDDVLVKLDDEYKRYDLIRAESQIMIAKADYDKSELDYKRYKKLFESKDISEFELENIGLKRDVAKAGHMAAEAGYKAARRQYNDTNIKAPFAGFLSQKKVAVGGLIKPGVPIGKIIDIRIVKSNVEIIESDMPRIKVEDDVKIHLDTYPDEAFAGKVSSISPEANPVTKTFLVEIELTNTADFKLKPGMVAKCKIITEVTDSTFLLPQNAVYENGSKRYIFININNKAVKNPVKTGRTYENKIEIIDGLQGHEKVVITESLFLNDGSKIVIQD